MQIKKYLVLLLSLCLIFVFGTIAVAQDGELTDVSGHWAEETIIKWSEEGAVGGYPDGTFQPNRQITRAEFITIINKALGCYKQENVNFSDVKESNWFYGEVAKAVKSGYIKGYEDGTFRPNSPISRQEAAVIFSRIMCLKADSQGVSDFADRNLIPLWSKDMVGAVTVAGYMGGYPDKTFQPTRSITRAESVVTLDRVVGELYNEAGIFGSETEVTTVQGNLTISKPDVTLQNIEVEGNLYLAEGIGDGTVTLKDVTVNGVTIVRGGGVHSIIMYNFNGKTVVVDVPDGSNVRLVAQGASSLEDVVLESDGILEEENLTGAGFTTVNIPAGAQVVLNGSFDNVDVQGAGASVKAESGTINNLNIAANATNAKVDLAKNTTVTNLTVEAPAAVSGTGTINTANVNSSNVTIEQKPVTQNLAEGVKANIGGEEVSGGTPVEDKGKGGGSPGGGTKSITVTDITVTFNNKAEDISDNTEPFSFDMSNYTDYPNNALLTGIKIGGSNIGGTLVITQVNIAGLPWLDKPIRAAISNEGVVLTAAILEGLDTGEPGINLGSLREFGQDIVISGYVERSGYSSSSPVDVTLQLSNMGPGVGDFTGIVNQWLDFEREGLKITGIIKEGKGDTPLKNVTVLEFLWDQGKVKTTGDVFVSGKTNIQAEILKLADGKTWDTATLSDLVGVNKSIYFKNPASTGVSPTFELVITNP
ncbi:MAG: S-layer homology domain-containing protein [Bacillota bacterium]